MLRGRPVVDSPFRSIAWVLVAAAGFRAWLLTTPLLRLDGDEAVTALMARRILDGEHRAYFAGSDYTGAGEQYLQAVVLAVLPDTDLTVRLPQLGLLVLACWLVHDLALRCGLSPRRSLLAAALFAVGPFFPVFWGLKSRGSYAAALVIGLAGACLALSTTPSDRRMPHKVFAFGVLVGLALWENPQAGYLLLPAGWWLVASVRHRLGSSALLGGAGFLVGHAPAIAHRLFGPDAIYTFSTDASFAARAEHLVDAALPDFLGVRDRGEPLFAWLPPSFVVLAAVAALGAALHAHRHAVWAVLCLDTQRRTGPALLLVALAVAPLLFVQPSISVAATARYLFVLYGITPVLLAALPVPRFARVVDHDVLAVLLVVVLAGHTLLGAHRPITEEADGHELPSGQVVDGDELEDVAELLERERERTAYADYWIATVLTWRAEDRVLVSTIGVDRFPHIARAVAGDPSPALVVAAEEVDAVREALVARGRRFDQHLVSGWGVFTGIEPGIHLGPGGTVREGIESAS